MRSFTFNGNFSDPAAMRFYRSTKTREQAEEWISWTLHNYRTHGVGLWVAEEKTSGRFLGQCGITPQDTGGVTEMEIGYLFARREWGKGYAAKAALACKEYGFKSLKYKKLVSIINVKNLASIRVAERKKHFSEREIRCMYIPYQTVSILEDVFIMFIKYLKKPFITASVWMEGF